VESGRKGLSRAKGFAFLSLEDETGIANVIVRPDLYEKNRVLINREKFARVEGVLQNQDNVISIKASRVMPIAAQPKHSHMIVIRERAQMGRSSDILGASD